MITGILLLFYITIVLFIYGSGLARFLFKNEPLHKPGFTLVMLLGLVAITTLASFASIFIRINWEFQLGLFIGAILLAIFVIRKPALHATDFFRRFNLAQKIGVIFLIACLLLTFLQALQTPSNSDTGIYHAQSIHWIERYPAVPGLANLHQRLGYNSSWLVANAVFSFSFLGKQSFHLLSGFLFLLMLGYFYQGIHQLLAKKYTLSNFTRLGCFLAVFIFLFDQVSSPGTDSPTTLLLWFILSESVSLLENKLLKDHKAGSLSIFMLTIFCITLKLSAAPILLIPFCWWVYLLAKKNFKLAGFSALSAVIIVIPFVARNIILTGYPVFPGFSIDLFHLDWALPITQVKKESTVIHWFALLPNVPMEEFAKMSFREQIVNWYVNQLPRHKAILLFIPASLLFKLSLCVFKKWRQIVRENLAVLLVYLTFLAGDLFWFASAPSIRFGYGFLLGTVFLMLFPVILYTVNRFPKTQTIFSWLLLIGTIGLAAVNFKTVIRYQDLASLVVYPADYPQWSSEPCKFKNFELLCQADYDSCWYSPFPCAIRGNLNVEMRGDDYQDGFRRVP